MIRSSLYRWLFSLLVITLVMTGGLTYSSIHAQDDQPAKKAEETESEKSEAESKESAVPSEADKTEADEEDSDEDEETEDFKKKTKPKKLIPDYMTLTKELMSEVKLDALKLELKTAKYSNILRKGAINRQERETINKWAKWSIYRLTLKKNEKTLTEVCDQIRKDVRNAGFHLTQGTVRSQFKQECIDNLLLYSEELLDGNFYVRLNLAILLGNLNIKKSTTSGEHAIPYAKAGKLLAQILEDPKQPIPVKLEAAKSLKTIGYYGNPDPQAKFKFTAALSKELLSDHNFETHYWYQNSLMGALASMDQIMDINRKATILQTLTAILVDSRRPWIVRSFAAKSIGRAKKDRTINIKLLAFEIVNMTREMSDIYNQSPANKDWNWCYFNSYLAYQTENKIENKIERKLGLLNQTGTDEYIDGSYFQVLKMVNHIDIMSEKQAPAFPEALLSEVDKWMKENQPSDRRIAPGMDPIVSTMKTSDEKQTTANAEDSSRKE